jgi:heterodisulfide reductase subunit C
VKIVGKKDMKVDSAFAEEIAKRSGENVFLCYQCRKCTSGCPSRMFMDSTPTELMRYAQLGMVDEAMKGNTIWYCLSCHTCSTRCPQDIDIAHVVDTIRIIVQEKNIKADTKNMRLFNWLWMPLGIKMIRRSKLKLLPSIRKPFTMIKMFSRAKKLKK